MTYRVLKGFNDISGHKNPGDTIDVTGWRAEKLQRARMIGSEVASSTEAAVACPEENAKAKPSETASKKPRAEKRG